MSNIHHQARLFQEVVARAHRADLERDLRLLPRASVDLAVVPRTDLAVECELVVRDGEVVLHHRGYALRAGDGGVLGWYLARGLHKGVTARSADQTSTYLRGVGRAGLVGELDALLQEEHEEQNQARSDESGDDRHYNVEHDIDCRGWSQLDEARGRAELARWKIAVDWGRNDDLCGDWRLTRERGEHRVRRGYNAVGLTRHVALCAATVDRAGCHIDCSPLRPHRTRAVRATSVAAVARLVAVSVAIAAVSQPQKRASDTCHRVGLGLPVEIDAPGTHCGDVRPTDPRTRVVDEDLLRTHRGT